MGSRCGGQQEGGRGESTRSFLAHQEPCHHLWIIRLLNGRREGGRDLWPHPHTHGSIRKVNKTVLVSQTDYCHQRQSLHSVPDHTPSCLQCTLAWMKAWSWSSSLVLCSTMPRYCSTVVSVTPAWPPRSSVMALESQPILEKRELIPRGREAGREGGRAREGGREGVYML